MPSQDQTNHYGDGALRDIPAPPDTSPADAADHRPALDTYSASIASGDTPPAPLLDTTDDRPSWTVDLPPVIPVTPLDGGDVPPPPAGLPDAPPLPPPGTPSEVPPVPPLPAETPNPEIPPVPALPEIPGAPPVPETPPTPVLPDPPPLPPLPGPPPVPPTPDAPALPEAPPVPPADLPPAAPTAGPGDQPLVPPTGDTPVAPAAEIPKSLPVDKEVVTVEGHEITIIGGPEKEVEGRKAQGDNPYDVRGDCGLVSSRDILLQFGVHVTEADVVKFAVEHGICAYDVSKPPENRGGTGTQAIIEVLHHYGVEAHGEYGGSLEQLATNIATGRGVIIGIESAVIWPEGEQPGFRPTGKADHAITVTGVSIEQSTGKILGFYINDSGAGNFGRFISADLMEKAWVNSGGGSVVTNAVTWAPV
jgi:hypothetical protein